VMNMGVRAGRAGGLQPPRLGQNHYFPAKVKFFGQKPAAKNEKSVFIKRRNGIHSVQRDKGKGKGSGKVALRLPQL